MKFLLLPAFVFFCCCLHGESLAFLSFASLSTSEGIVPYDNMGRKNKKKTKKKKRSIKVITVTLSV